MATNTKIRTEDVLEIFDFKIKTSSAHAQLDVVSGEFYDSVLSKIAARSPSLDEKNALDNAVNPSISNPFVTVSELDAALGGTIPWKTIGPVGSGSDFEGSGESAFLAAFATPNVWFYVKPATYTFTSTVTVPNGVKVVGGVTGSTIITSSTGTPFILIDDVFLAFVTVMTSAASSTAVVASASARVEIKNCIFASTSSGNTLDISDSVKFSSTDCAFLVGNLVGTNAIQLSIASAYFDASGTYGLRLDTIDDFIMWGSTFFAGTPQIISGSNVRIVGNHFNNGITNTTPVSSVLLRANTPTANNNEDESLTYLLQYLGSPSALQTTPSYSSNFTGPQAEDLTSRASAIDLCLQWIYEERNFSLVAKSEPLVVSWDPVNMLLTSTNTILLVSAHRNAVWQLPAISETIPNGWFLYYVIDRSLITSDIVLTPILAPLGSIPIDTNPPTGSPNNRQIYTLAYNLNGTLWWRGGGGSRFPATGGYVGDYFVDGSSKSLLNYLGAEDYNDSQPDYSNNFAGIQGESLTVRLSKTDQLLQRLFEHSNLGYYLSVDGYFSSDAIGELVLNGDLTFKLPHISGAIVVAGSSWTIPDGSLLYFSWDQVALGAATAIVATNVPLPDAYPLTTKYFVAAVRIGTMFYLWDGTRLPMSGGRWPLESSARNVVPTSLATTYQSHYLFKVNAAYASVGSIYTSGGNTYTILSSIAGQTKLLCSGTNVPSTSTGVLTLSSGAGDISITYTSYTAGYPVSNNTAWIDLNGVRHFLWENLAVLTSTGIPLDRNVLPNQPVPLVGLTDLSQGEGILITHTWNAGSSQQATMQKVSLPLSFILEQNQFLWVQNRTDYLLFTGEG